MMTLTVPNPGCHAYLPASALLKCKTRTHGIMCKSNVDNVCACSLWPVCCTPYATGKTGHCDETTEKRNWKKLKIEMS